MRQWGTVRKSDTVGNSEIVRYSESVGNSKKNSETVGDSEKQ